MSFLSLNADGYWAILIAAVLSFLFAYILTRNGKNNKALLGKIKAGDSVQLWSDVLIYKSGHIMPWYLVLNKSADFIVIKVGNDNAEVSTTRIFNHKANKDESFNDK